MRPLRFAVVGSERRWSNAMEALVKALGRRGVDITPVSYPSYAGLYEAIDLGACEAAWAPPLVALDLLRSAAALPIARPVRDGQTAYYSVLLAKDNRRSFVDMPRDRRMAWVAPESAAGYVVPRLGLRSLGLEVDDVFATQTFFGKHHTAIEAVQSGRAEIVATYGSLDRSRRTLLPPLGAEGLHVVAAYGPIPSDVVVVSPAIPPGWQRAIAYALGVIEPSEVRPLVEVMRFDRFEPANATHLRPLEMIDRRSEDGALRSFAPFAVWSFGHPTSAPLPSTSNPGRPRDDVGRMKRAFAGD